jgi:urease accessory protein
MHRILTPALALSLAAVPAFAQVAPEVAAGDFSAGFIRPFSGLGHLFALIAVGLIAAQHGGRSLWEMPLAFLAAMLAGYLLAFLRVPLPFTSHVIAGSVVVLGLLIALNRKLSPNNTLILIAIFGLFHGNAQGFVVRGSDAVSTGLGFAIASTLIAAAVVILGVAGLKAFAKQRSGSYLSWTGWVIAAIGVLLFFLPAT